MMLCAVPDTPDNGRSVSGTLVRMAEIILEVLLITHSLQSDS